MTKIDNTPFYVAFDQRFAYVRGLDSATALLAEFLGCTVEHVRANRRKVAGLIQRVSAAQARAAGV